ncbi:MAG: phenylacetate--CoA ligase family protein [Saprospiraceae bacterium]
MAGLLTDLYRFSPAWVQNIGVSLYGFQWQRRRFGGVFDREYAGFKEREGYTHDQWNDYQNEHLNRLLLSAFKNVPYYQAKYEKAGFDASDLSKIDLTTLAKLPIIEKAELREYGDNSLLSLKREKNGVFFTSSGSTGTPVKLLFSDAMHQRWSAAFEARIRNWAGLDRFHSRGMIGGRNILGNNYDRPPYFRYNYFEKQVYFSIYHISKKNARYYYETILNYGLDYMTGYAISNALLASFFEEEGWAPIPLKAVITSSEKLTPSMRGIFNRVYGCKTYDSYSGIEACGLFSEKPDGNMYSSPDVGILEIVDEHGNPCPEGTSGEVLFTGLLNFDQPLIRYRIGDLATLASSAGKSTSFSMPQISEIVGRTDDVLCLPGGKKIASFNRIFADINGIIEAQVIQQDICKLLLNLVVSPGFNKIEEHKLIKIIQERFGNELSLEICFLEHIPRGKNGKYKAVISHIKNV